MISAYSAVSKQADWEKDLFINIEDAVRLSRIPASVFLSTLLKHQIIYHSLVPINIFDYDECSKHLSEILIPINELPNFAQKDYIKENISINLTVDFSGFRSYYGDADTLQLFKEIQAVNDIHNRYERYYHNDRAFLLDSLLAKHNFNRTQFYNLRKGLMKQNLIYKLNQPESTFHCSLCLLAENYIIERLFSIDEQSQDDIIDSLKNFSVTNAGQNACYNCPFNESSPAYEKAKKQLLHKAPFYHLRICLKDKKGIYISPNSDRSIVSRIQNSLPKQLIYFARDNRNIWDARFGHRISRSPLKMINQMWCADEHQLDVYLYDQKKKQYRRPWVSLIIDVASGVIVGSSISFYNNQQTTIEAFARAAVPTIESGGIIHGLPLCFQADNGSSYKGKRIIGSKQARKLLKDNPEATLFFEGLLPALGIKTLFCKPRSPWSKPIERVFRTIEKRWMRRIPGFCGGRKRSKFHNNPELALERLIKANMIWDMETFANFWFKRVVPEYNNYSCRKKRTPMAKYLSLKRADTKTPSWATMSVVMEKKHYAKVTSKGIYYNNMLYDDLKLSDYIDKKVLVYSLQNAYANSIYVVYSDPIAKQDHFIEEIPLKEFVSPIEENKLKLSRNLVIHNLQVKNNIQRIDAVHTLAEISETNRPVFIKYHIEENSIEPYIFCETPINNPQIPTTHLSKEALKLYRWECEKELEIIDEAIKCFK